MKQEKFEKVIQKFNSFETARGEFWFMAQDMKNNGFEIEAYILILATWNFAGWRYIMRTFDMGEFRETMEDLEPLFKKFENIKFQDADLDDPEVVADIKTIYSKLKKLVKQTGATKVMAIKNPDFFVMWDTKIRKMYKIKNSASPDDYIKFLKKIQNEFGNIKWSNNKTPFAKAIDEYNYLVTEQ